MADEVTVEVDHEYCYGAQNCALAAPGVFEYDEDGKAVVSNLGAATVAQLREAEDNCPAAAIRLSGVPAH